MPIVPIGKVSLQVPDSNSPTFILDLVAEIQPLLLDVIGRLIEESLETELERFLAASVIAVDDGPSQKKAGCTAAAAARTGARTFSATVTTCASCRSVGARCRCTCPKPTASVAVMCA